MEIGDQLCNLELFFHMKAVGIHVYVTEGPGWRGSQQSFEKKKKKKSLV